MIPSREKDRMKIRILDEETIGRIAAGEIIERPASIVKELMENSLDAGAKKVTVEVYEGGATSIRVSDDGCGMSSEDLRMSVARHATSKIERSDDLWNLVTYGFRGEALPSIASVSRLEILSRQEGDETGHRLIIEGGTEVGFSEEARRPGTTVTVTKLFFNSPARRKFLKSAATEFRHVVKTFLSYALARLDVAFTLKRGGDSYLDVVPAPTLSSRMEALYSPKYMEKMFKVLSSHGEITLGGFIIDPNKTRESGAEQWLFVNGRPCQSRPVTAAVHEGYSSTLPPRASPDFLLFLTLPPGEVDVNVHPTKREVKFRDQGKVYDLVAASIKKTLGSPAARESHFNDLHRLSSSKYVLHGREQLTPREGASTSARQMALFMQADPSSGTATEGGREILREKSPLTQIHQTYIVATTESGIVIIDQHAAHERIVYEELMRAFQSGSVDAQRLLFPLTVSLSHQEDIVLKEYMSLLDKFGFEMEPFGERTYLIQAIPSLNPGVDIETALHSILADLSEKGAHEMNQYERLAKVIACRTAIKAGEQLTEAQMSEILDCLFMTELPFSDIHGRPTLVHIDLEELKRRFGRS
jgi:DNA mismatch repair protein MutL